MACFTLSETVKCHKNSNSDSSFFFQRTVCRRQGEPNHTRTHNRKKNLFFYQCHEPSTLYQTCQFQIINIINNLHNIVPNFVYTGISKQYNICNGFVVFTIRHKSSGNCTILRSHELHFEIYHDNLQNVQSMQWTLFGTLSTREYF